MKHLNKLIFKDLVIGLPKHKFEKDRLCDACKKRKTSKGFLQIKEYCVYNSTFTTSPYGSFLPL